MNKIALSPNSLVGVPALEYIDALARADYDGIGLRLYASPGVTYESVTQPVTGNPALMHDIKSALEGSGLITYDALSYYIRPNFNLEHMLPSLEFASELGFQYALAIADDPDWNRQVDNLSQLCDAAARLDLTISLEGPVTQNTVNTLPMALDLIRQTGKQNLVICLDPYHFFRAGHSPSMLKDQEPRLFPYTQFRDGIPRPEPGPAAWSDMGAGSVPLHDILDNLPAGIPLSIEWSRPRDSNYTPAEWAKVALDGTRRVVDAYYAKKR